MHLPQQQRRFRNSNAPKISNQWKLAKCFERKDLSSENKRRESRNDGHFIVHSLPFIRTNSFSFDRNRDLVFSMETSARDVEDWVNIEFASGVLRLRPRN